MRQLWKRGGMVVCCLLPSAGSYAASFECQRAVSVVERNICQDVTLSRLDSEMAGAYDRARHRAGAHVDALLRDQRNWLGERNKAAISGAGRAANVYRNRIEFLDKTFQDKELPSPLLAAIQAFVEAHPAASAGRGYVISGWGGIGGGGDAFTMAEESPVQDAKSLPFRLEDVRELITFPDSADDYRTLALLRAQRLGGVYSESGTMHSVSWRLFSWDGHAVKGVVLPDAFSDTEWTNLGALVEHQGIAYALSYYDAPLDRSVLTAQAFVGGQWGDDVQLELHYDVHFQPSRSYCSETNCTALEAFAEKFVRQFDKTQDVSPLIAGLSKDDRERYRDMLGRDKSLTSLPTFEGKTHFADAAVYRSFGSDSAFFPVHWQGKLLLGRVGNASLGWRESEDLLLGIWRWNGKALEPVLGMVTGKVRGGFLLSAWSRELSEAEGGGEN